MIKRTIGGFMVGSTDIILGDNELNHYLVVIDYCECFIVGAIDEDEALNKIANYCKDNDYLGVVHTYDDIKMLVNEYGYNEDAFLQCGDNGLYINIEALSISVIKEAR